jgi:2-polyprenyl-3-methyl-5-hydroxy-6-metoxy-1,4-benzoquinol methylase
MKHSNPYLIKTDPYSSHSIIRRWIHLFPLPNKKVIEIGIAEGIMGRIEQFREYRLIGIEINEYWADQAKKYYDEIIVGDIQELEGDIFINADCIILADVLEHLPDPHQTLDKILGQISNNCSVIISVPNIANIWVRINLLFGKFNYSDRGILDRTHLHFFTKKTLVKMIQEANLSIIKLDYTPIPLNLVHPFFSKNNLGAFLLKILSFISKKIPTLFAYQILVFGRK